MQEAAIAAGIIEAPKPVDTEKLRELQQRLAILEAERLLGAARCSAAPREPRAVINGKVVTGPELIQAFREMPKSDRQSLIQDLKLLDILEDEAQQNEKLCHGAEKTSKLST